MTETAREMLEKLERRNLEPDHAMLYRAARRTFNQLGWLAKEIKSLLKKILDATGEETN